MSWEARGAMIVPKTDVVGVVIDAVSPIRVVVTSEVVIIVVVMGVVVEMMSDTSEVIGTCYKSDQRLARKGPCAIRDYNFTVLYYQYEIDRYTEVKFCFSRITVKNHY